MKYSLSRPLVHFLRLMKFTMPLAVLWMGITI